MGLFSSNDPPVALHPVHPPLGLNPAYYAQQPTTLVAREKVFSWSGDDFGIKDLNGVVVVRCKGKAFSFRDRKVITDAQGRDLLYLKSKLLSLHKTVLVEDPSGTELVQVRKHISFLGTKMSATFRNASTGQDTAIDLRGSILGGSAELTVGDMPIASIRRKLFTAAQVFADQQTYFITVAPGVDLALVSVLCICFDEIAHENSNNNL